MRVRVDGSRPPRTRLVRRVRALGALPLVMTPLAACTAGPASAPAPPPAPAAISGLAPGVAATLSPAAHDAVAGALATYNGYFAAYVTAAATADGPTAGIDRYAADPLRQQAHLALRAYANAGVVLRGKPANSPTVTAINVATSPYSVTLSDCVDASNWRPVVRKTGADATATNQPVRHRVIVTVVEYPHGVWYVQQIVDSAEPAC